MLDRGFPFVVLGGVSCLCSAEVVLVLFAFLVLKREYLAKFSSAVIFEAAPAIVEFAIAAAATPSF